MSDGRALLSAICANPDEDTPRLALVDPQNFPWLAQLDALGAAKNSMQKKRFGDRVRC